MGCLTWQPPEHVRHSAQHRSVVALNGSPCAFTKIRKRPEDAP
ncbi:putative transcriptional regulator (plasmid) [Acetobacter orientalis]|uniref:Putative transcriptional regulator n=1 Tax=Acetobacter orientalis TaxID=146474 RepID=A0A2Z5ZM83_9PROT|nr:putative transcriptional regulator [Acetobacter orientalis]